MAEQQDNTKLKIFHDGLIKANYEVPDYASFEQTLQDPLKAKTFYDGLVKANYELPDYDTFVSDLGLKKKGSPSDYGLPTEKVFSDIFSKVAGDIPKIERGNTQTTPDIVTPPSEDPIEYPHWTDVSKALGIPLSKEIEKISEDYGVNPRALGKPEVIGKKPDVTKPEVKKLGEGELKKEITQPTDNLIVKADIHEPYVFTVEDYLKKRDVTPAEVGLDPNVNTDRLIDIDEKIDFDKKLEAKGLYSPVPKAPESYIGAFSKGVYKGVANMVRDIGFILNEVPAGAASMMAQGGMKLGAKIKGLDSETTKKYMEQVSSAIGNGMYGNASIMKEGYEQSAKWLEEVIKFRTPDNSWGRALESTGSFIPDLISMGLMPEAKAPLLVKYGMQGMIKFPAYLGAKTYIEGAKQGKTPKEIVSTSAEAAAQGMLYNGLGVWAHEIGAISKSVGAGLWTSKATEVLANSLGFGGLTKAEGGSVEEGFLTGLAFSGLGMPEMIKQGMQKKAMLNWMTATDNNIRMVASQKIDPFKLRKESQDLWEKAQALPEGEAKDHLLWQKNMVDNTIDISFMTNQILRNPQAFIQSINENPMLSAREKKVWTNKFNNTVNMVDPRILEAQPITENIKSLESELQYWNDKTDAEPDVKASKIEALTNQIKETKDKRIDIFSKPLEDYAPKPEKKSETAPEEEIKPQTPEEIAKENGVTFIGKQEGVEKDGSDALDMYNVKIKGKEATFTVPSGSDATVVKAKKEAKIKEFKVKPSDEEARVQKALAKASKKKRSTAFKPESRTGKAVSKPPNDFTEAALQFFVGGGRIKTQDLMDNTGYKKGDKDLNVLFGLHKKEGVNLDVFHEALENSFGMEEKGAMDMTNAVIDLIKQYPSRGQMLLELERRQGEQKQLEPSNEELKAEEDALIAEGKAKELSESYDIDQDLKNGLITKSEYDEITDYLSRQAEQGRLAEESFNTDLTSEGKAGEEEISKPEEVKPETPDNEKPSEQPNPPVSKGEENNLPGGAEDISKPVEKQGKAKPIRTTDPGKQKQIEAIDKDYDTQIADQETIIPKAEEDMRKALLEADTRNGLFGDTKPVEKDEIIKREEQGFTYNEETRKAVRKPFEEKIAEANKKIASLNKERESKIGEVLKQQTLGFEEPAKVEPTKEGIKFKDKTYTEVDQVLDALDKGEITFEESKQLREDVGKFEDGLKAEAKKISDDIGNKMDKGASDIDKKIQDDINDKNSKLNIKILPPDIISMGNTALWKQLVKGRDAIANAIAKQLGKGVKSQTDAIRWSSKVLTNLYQGLLRTQADMFGTGKEGHIGKLEMMGTVKAYAPHKGFDLLKTWEGIVNSDSEALRRVLDVLDPEIAIENLKYGDLSLAEKNLYFAMKEWNTWLWSTNYANDFIPTESHLKFKGDFEHTGLSDYIARMYDAYEEGTILSPEIQEFISRGNSAVTSRLNTDYMKLREETNEWKKEHAIRNPAYLTAKRVMQTIQNVAIKQYMDMIIAEHPDFVVKVKKGEEVPKGYTKLGSSYSWGPFRNKAVINHIVEDFTGFYYQNAIVNTAYDAIKMWDRTKINQFYKKWRTVYNPFVQTGNVTGNVFFASINGINPFAFVKGMIDNRNLHQTNPAQYDLLLKSGLIGDTAFTGEMKPADILNPKQGALGKADELAMKAYAGADNLAKISAYQIFRRQGLSHQQAVRRAYDSFQNYATVGKTWDISSKIPLIGPTFVKFQADLQRILVNNMLTAPLTTIGTLMMIKMLGNLSSALSGETEEEQEIRESRKGVAKIPFVNIPLSFKVGKSEVNVARYLSPLYLYNRGDSEMDMSELSKFMPIQFQKKDDESLFPLPAFADATWGWVGSVLTDRDFRMMSIQDPFSTRYTNPNITTDERIMNVLNYVGRSQIPFYKGAQDIYKGATGQLDYYGRKRTWGQAILNNIIKIQEFDKPELKNYVERNLSYLTSRYASLATRMGDANGNFFKNIKYAEDKGLAPEVISKLYEKESKIRDKRLQKSLDEQIPVMQEIERLTNTYKGWYPQDPFIQENFQNIESGKNQRFNVIDDIDMQKKYKDEYMLLKSNGLLKKPEVPAYLNGTLLTEEQRKKYTSDYWSEYVRQLDAMIGLTQEEFDEEKQYIVGREESTTTPMPKETSLLEAKSSSAATVARSIAEANLRMNINQ